MAILRWEHAKRRYREATISDTGCRMGPMQTGMSQHAFSSFRRLTLSSGAVFMALSYEEPIARAYFPVEYLLYLIDISL